MRPPAPDDACVDPLAPVPPTLDAIKLSVALSAARLEARRARADATAARAEAAALASRLDAALRAAAGFKARLPPGSGAKGAPDGVEAVASANAAARSATADADRFRAAADAASAEAAIECAVLAEEAASARLLAASRARELGRQAGRLQGAVAAVEAARAENKRVHAELELVRRELRSQTGRADAEAARANAAAADADAAVSRAAGLRTDLDVACRGASTASYDDQLERMRAAERVARADAERWKAKATVQMACCAHGNGGRPARPHADAHAQTERPATTISPSRHTQTRPDPALAAAPADASRLQDRLWIAVEAVEDARAGEAVATLAAAAEADRGAALAAALLTGRRRRGVWVPDA